MRSRAAWSVSQVRELRGKVVGLVGHEGAQRVDEDARAAVQDGLARRVDVEDEGLAAAGGHDGHAGTTPAKQLEGTSLGGQQGPLPNEAAHELEGELLRCQSRKGGAGLGRGGPVLPRVDGPRAGRALREAAVLAAAQLGEKLGRAGDALVAVADVAHHELGLGAALPGLVHGLEDEVDGAVAGGRTLHVRGAEHDGRDAGHAVRGKKAQVGAVRPHARAVAHGDAHAREQRLLVALAKGLEHL